MWDLDSLLLLDSSIISQYRYWITSSDDDKRLLTSIWMCFCAFVNYCGGAFWWGVQTKIKNNNKKSSSFFIIIHYFYVSSILEYHYLQLQQQCHQLHHHKPINLQKKTLTEIVVSPSKSLVNINYEENSRILQLKNVGRKSMHLGNVLRRMD